MVIQIDTREKPRAIERILAEFDKRGVKHISSKLYVGDYMNLDNPKLIIDRKQNLLEVVQNVCQGHDRFINELKRAKEAGIHLIILVEHGNGIRSLSDVINWKNPRCAISPLAMSGERLYRVLKTISVKYDVDFVFCTKWQTGKMIIKLLEVKT